MTFVSIVLVAFTLLFPKARAAGEPKGEVKYINGQPITREQFEQVKKVPLSVVEGALDEMFGGMPKATWKLPPQFDRSPPLKDVGPKDLKVLANCCLVSGRPAFGGLRIKLSVGVPNAKSASVELDSMKLLYKGKLVEFSQPPRLGSSIDSGSTTLDLEVKGIEDLKAAVQGRQLKGTIAFRLKVPTKISTVTFDAKEVGVTKQGITLKESKNGNVVFEGPERSFGDAAIWGKDEEGMNYDEKSSSSESPEVRQAYEALMKKNWEDVPEKTEFKPTKVTRKVLYSAAPLKYVVQIPVKFTEKKLSLPVPFSEEMDRDVFAAPVERKICNLDQAKVNAMTKMATTRSQAMSGFGMPTLYVKLPSCDNSLFAKGAIEQMKFVGAGNKEIKDVEIENGLISIDDFTDEVRFKPKGDSREDSSFPELKGVIAKAKYDIPELEVVRVTKGKPSNGKVKAKFSGTKVTVSHPRPDDRYEEPSFGKGLGRIAIYDRFGRLLDEPNTSSSSTGGVTTTEYQMPVPAEAVEVVMVKPGFVVEKTVRMAFPAGPTPKATPAPTQAEPEAANPEE